ncbi:succinyl-CoA ligase subunit beta [Salpingoeca rosetta]|uniref:Succinate--CoA ligase [ADP-forming] subunit beta, mitochondrial n=1 Tax=Salpingoeca rosetta (strain ATCC 50818 / BSB-021) TaxID=946362 RepID=F2U0G0_SALR5|nr:succinyl-CoA ligase subunit beta [Salpingoeca rosetta]EGD80888.1 succinyl-CoA ligase subunit beta [Salpingoeca rosetta]|eukprot:XP_004997449.1 succinyl-CoA ligase subunit beta [Salpingoeca rosetta]
MLSRVLGQGLRLGARGSPALTSLGGARRLLNIHEADSQELMKSYGLNVARGAKAKSPEEAVTAAKSMSTSKVVLKAQVLAGGRGKGVFDNGFSGGVHVLDNDESKVREIASQMIGHNLITKQTGKEGRPCNMIQVVEAVNVQKEFYLALLLDRAAMGPVMIGSSQGGMDIEAVAAENPDAIVKLPIDIDGGLSMEAATNFARQMGIPDSCVDSAADQMVKLYQLFLERDCSLVEINPFAQVGPSEVMCLDAKLNFDDNAEFRQSGVFEKRDTTQENKADVEAAKFDLNYIQLDGNIGCLVNGAGLAMATMDIIQLHGGSPANFLDVGGGATARQVTEAFKLITQDPNVSAILVNIFGGIMRCDVIAEGIIHAASDLDLSVPIIVRLQGTNREEAKEMIANSGLDIISSDELDDAAFRAVQLSKIVELARQAHVHVTFREAERPHHDDDVMTPYFT